MIVRGQPKNAEVHVMFRLSYRLATLLHKKPPTEEDYGSDATSPAPEIQQAAPARHTVSTEHLLSEEDLNAMRREGM
jgi:hypothetical protein